MRQMQILHLNFHFVIESTPVGPQHWLSWLYTAPKWWTWVPWGDQTWWAEQSVWGLRRRRAAKSTQSTKETEGNRDMRVDRVSRFVSIWVQYLHDFADYRLNCWEEKRNAILNAIRATLVWFLGLIFCCFGAKVDIYFRWDLVKRPCRLSLTEMQHNLMEIFF